MFLRAGGGLAAGVVGAAVLLYLGVYLCHMIYPLPADLDTRDSSALANYMAAAPPSVLLVFLATWFVAALGGAFTAARIAGAPSAWLSGALLLALALANLARVPQPLWLSVGEIVAIIAATGIAARR
jgi:hypothetical protein